MNERKLAIGRAIITACIALIAFAVGIVVGASLMPEPADAAIENHGGRDWVVLDHEGTHYVIELGGAE